MKSNQEELNCLIVDDKSLAIDLLENFAIRSGKFSTIFKTTQPENAQELIKKNKIDILFLDIHMPQMTGLELANSITEKPALIFTTAYAEYGVTAFDMDAVDYLIKPFSYERFVRAMEKAIQLIKSKTKKEEEYLTIKSDGIFHRVIINDIIYIEGKKDYVQFHCLGNKKYTTLLNMTELEKRLSEYSIIRSHKSYLISLKKIHKYNADQIIMSNEAVLPLARSKKTELLALMKK